MLKSSKFYELIDRNAKVTLIDKKGKATYCGALKSIPDAYDDIEIKDFEVTNDCNFKFWCK